MLLPYWTNNCIGSMEGLLFESSATTPYHFLNQAELSLRPSDPMVGLPYGPSGAPDVRLGLRHLQMLGVRYFEAFSPTIVAAARRDPLVTEIASTGPWRFDSHVRTWHLFELRSAPMVVGLTTLPNVVTSLGSRDAWLSANVAWWLAPSRWDIALAQSGPSTWPHTGSVTRTTKVRVGPARITRATVGISTISFHVDKVGVPVLVRVSYYPRWHATGASGPYRVSPNLMVVVPTSHTVELTYASSPWLTAGVAVTAAAVVTTVVAAVGATIGERRRRRRR